METYYVKWRHSRSFCGDLLDSLSNPLTSDCCPTSVCFVPNTHGPAVFQGVLDSSQRFDLGTRLSIIGKAEFRAL